VLSTRSVISRQIPEVKTPEKTYLMQDPVSPSRLSLRLKRRTSSLSEHNYILFIDKENNLIVYEMNFFTVT
jgi:hypothetical protein